ncbi:MAG: RNA methyltransferase [Bradyrhizobiaceae bacterium]|nr:RNA methyltransferase [Bradyrhizobiaceae bacterium]
MRHDSRRDRRGGRHSPRPGSLRPGSGKFAAGPRRAPRRTDAAVLYGWHTVKAALQNPQRRFHRLLATEAAVRRLTEDNVKLPCAPTLSAPEDIAAVAGAGAVHQGLYAEADPLASPELEDVVGGGVVVALDQVTDPHNFGAILRSAAAFSVKAVVTTERHSPQASGALAKAASGALEYVPVVTVVNLARALDELRDLSAFVVGLDSSGEADLAAMALSAPLALVVGAEGKGLRHLTRARCNAVARLALPGRITSLNVSNATAVALYVATAKLAGRG